ncbi:hypothetical protein D3C78_1339700 [compost metagenome]
MLIMRAGSWAVPANSSRGQSPWISRNGACRLRSNTEVQSSSVTAPSGGALNTPALLISTSRCEQRSRTHRISSARCSAWTRSHSMNSKPPSSASSRFRRSAAARPRPATSTRHPAATKERVIMAPIPFAPPVIKTVLSATENNSETTL